MNQRTKYPGVLFFLVILIMVSCSQPAPVQAPTITPSVTAIPVITQTPSPLPTSLAPQVQALVKNSVEFYRNGKTYEVVIGYDAGDIFWNVTPRPDMPKKLDEVGWGSPELNGYGDFDQDGETEFYVTVYYCGASCSGELRLYEYDPLQDQYSVADTVSARKFDLRQYADLNQDGNPELTIKGLGYCLYGEAGEKTFSTVVVMRYENGKMTDVTKAFPDVIAKDAEHYLSFSQTDGGHQGVAELTLASYLYDMYRLRKLDEARPNFNQVCNDVVKPREEKAGRSTDCLAFLAEVETDIQKYEQSQK